MLVNGGRDLFGYWHSSKYLSLCSAEQRNPYRFGTTWGGVNDDRIFIFGWTIPLKVLLLLTKTSKNSFFCEIKWNINNDKKNVYIYIYIY